MDYKIYMEEIGDLKEGWSCGSGKRSNQPHYRTPNKSDADTYDKFNAVLFSAEFKKYGYPNHIVPKVSPKDRLEILES